MAVYITLYKDSGIGEGFSFFGKRLERTYNDGESGCECSGEGGCPSFVGEDRPFGKPGQPLFGGELKRLKGGGHTHICINSIFRNFVRRW